MQRYFKQIVENNAEAHESDEIGDSRQGRQPLQIGDVVDENQWHQKEEHVEPQGEYRHVVVQHGLYVLSHENNVHATDAQLVHNQEHVHDDPEKEKFGSVQIISGKAGSHQLREKR